MSGMTMKEVDARIKDLEYQRKHLGMDDEEFVREIGNIMSLEETSVLFREIVKENQDLRRQLTACRENAPKWLRAQNTQLRSAAQSFEEQLSRTEDERDALRRQLAECQAELATAVMLPPATCGDRGFVGYSACHLPAGHDGPHEHRSFVADYEEKARGLSSRR